MEAASLTDVVGVKRHTFLVVLSVNHTDSDIVDFLHIAMSLVFKISNECQVSDKNVSSVVKRKRNIHDG